MFIYESIISSLYDRDANHMSFIHFFLGTLPSRYNNLIHYNILRLLYVLNYLRYIVLPRFYYNLSLVGINTHYDNYNLNNFFGLKY